MVENHHRNYRLAVSSCAKNEASFLAPIVTLFSIREINSLVEGRVALGSAPDSWRRRLRARRSAPYRCLSSAKSLGRRSERLDLRELRQQRVLIVIAVAGNHLLSLSKCQTSQNCSDIRRPVGFSEPNSPPFVPSPVN